ERVDQQHHRRHTQPGDQRALAQRARIEQRVPLLPAFAEQGHHLRAPSAAALSPALTVVSTNSMYGGTSGLLSASFAGTAGGRRISIDENSRPCSTGSRLSRWMYAGTSSGAITRPWIATSPAPPTVNPVSHSPSSAWRENAWK